MTSPHIDVKIVRPAGFPPAFCTVLPYIPPKECEVVWAGRVNHYNDQRIEQPTMINDYVSTAIDQGA